MIDHIWTVVCSRAVIDRYTNRVSLENVIEQITVQGEAEPERIIPIPVDVLTLWGRSDLTVPATGHQRLTLVSPSGELIKSHEFEINLRQRRAG